MTVETLPDKANRHLAFFTSSDFGPKPRKQYMHALPDGTQAYRLEHVPVFRSGEFMDSMGYEHLWEPLHIEIMASNFRLLRDTGAFPDPPVRAGHPEIFSNNMKNLIGYVQDIVAEKAVSPVDGSEYTYLFVDFEILDEEAAGKIASGLWRHRSAEIGGYVTNNKSEFWPVLAGFAYVDIPAVEGLDFSKFTKAGKDYTIVVESDNKEEGQVAKENEQDSGQGGTSTHGASNANGSSATVVPAPPAPLAPHTFTISGAQVTDYAAVQAHIDELETFQRETTEAGRKNFITELVNTNRLFAAQQTPMTELVLGMSDAQFAQFRDSYTGVPEMPILGNHSVEAQAGGTPEAGEHEDPAVEQAKRNYSRHQLANMPAEQLAQTASAKLLREKGIIQ